MNEHESPTTPPSPNSIEALMKSQDLDNCDEKIDEAFLCCVCLDLLYKPIVLACGHISCFWCVHRAMSFYSESHCPVCRCPYRHFPSICQLLHFMLLKMYPQAYRRRDNQMLEEEKKDECFSPQFDNYLANFHNSKDLIIHTCSTANINSPTIVEHGNINLSFSDKTTVFPGETNSRHLEATNALVVEENTSQKGRDHEAVFVSDVLCIACKQILFRPTVLNCGHVYCESCIAAPVGDLRCQLCECSHPEGLPKVCLELDHFLEERFPEEYALKKEAVRLQLIECQVGIPSTGAIQPQKQGAKSSSSSNQKYLSWFRERGLKVHVGVGCDYCGMFPIIGKRYRCKDCVEKIGFDLCGECYNSRSKLPGRFNQQHTPEHKFQLERSTLRNMLLSFVSEQSNDGTTVPPLSAEEAEAAHAINEAVEEGEGPNSGI